MQPRFPILVPNGKTVADATVQETQIGKLIEQLISVT
jgi:hypothetical protein